MLRKGTEMGPGLGHQSGKERLPSHVEVFTRYRWLRLFRFTCAYPALLELMDYATPSNCLDCQTTYLRLVQDNSSLSGPESLGALASFKDRYESLFWRSDCIAATATT